MSNNDVTQRLLHPIYVALDHYQYTRAIKCAVNLLDKEGLPEDAKHLAQALLAHSYLKNNQPLLALQTLQQVLGDDQELNLARERMQLAEAALSGPAPPSQAQQQQSSTSKSKKGKKNKASVTSSTSSNSQSQTAASAPATTSLDVLDLLEPTVKLSEAATSTNVASLTTLTDSTTVDTLAMTLRALRLYGVVYRMCKCAAADPLANQKLWLHQQYTSGLQLFLTTTTNSSKDVTANANLLSDLQVAAVQLAKHKGVDTSWAAQTALWQLHEHNQISNSSEDPKRQMQLQMLPRLAEKWSETLLKTITEKPIPDEHVRLFVSSLQQQEGAHEKLRDLYENLKEKNNTTMSHQDVLQGLAEAHVALKDFSKARALYRELLDLVPNHEYYKAFLQCSAQIEGGMKQAGEELQEGVSHQARLHLLRRIEWAAAQHQQEETNNLQSYLAAIEAYARVFAKKTCAYPDVESHLEICITKIPSEVTEWARKELHRLQAQQDGDSLQEYVFYTKVLCKVVAIQKTDEWLPDWKEIHQKWRASQEDEKQTAAGEELVLLAVQVILHTTASTAHLLTAATWLHEALRRSPHSASLKIAAIGIYGQLDAALSAWQLFETLSIKHVQLDSCSHVILPILTRGGLYQESISLSTTILRFHASASRDCGDYCARAMEVGTLSKADEFLVFQRERMSKSLALLEVKGRILDCAPLLSVPPGKHDCILGKQQGIVGNTERDMERAIKMAQEAHNLMGAPWLISAATMSPSVDDFSDNRDLNMVVKTQILFQTIPANRDEVLRDSLRRGHIHGLLLRTVLCANATKGPKKGKLVKPSDVLTKRCQSLLEASTRAFDFNQGGKDAPGYKDMMMAAIILCRTVVLVSSGLPESGSGEDLSGRDLRAGETIDAAINHLRNAVTERNQETLADICQFLPECVVPLFALVRITANIFANYGWGKRKCKTKSSAKAIADLASALNGWVVAETKVLERIPKDDASVAAKIEAFLELLDSGLVDESSARTVAQQTVMSQQTTRDRVMPFLDEIRKELDSFEIHDASN